MARLRTAVNATIEEPIAGVVAREAADPGFVGAVARTRDGVAFPAADLAFFLAAEAARRLAHGAGIAHVGVALARAGVGAA
jgi:hypothetical protein